MKRSGMNRTLARELRAIGVPEQEIAELTHAAERLSMLHVPGMSRAAKQRVSERLPFDVEVYGGPRRIPTVRWALAGSFAVLALVIGATWAALPTTPGTPAHQTDNQTEKARQDVRPEQVEEVLEERAAEIQQLQEQPTVDEQELQKARDKFRRDYERYERLRGKTNKQDPGSPWSNYQSQPWWQSQSGSSGSGQTQSATQ